MFLFKCYARFIRSEEDDMDHSWEQRLVKRYYDKLFKEYPLLVDPCFTELIGIERDLADFYLLWILF